MTDMGKISGFEGGGNRGIGGLCTIISFKEDSLFCQGLKIGIPRSRVIILWLKLAKVPKKILKMMMTYRVFECYDDESVKCVALDWRRGRHRWNGSAVTSSVRKLDMAPAAEDNAKDRRQQVAFPRAKQHPKAFSLNVCVACAWWMYDLLCVCLFDGWRAVNYSLCLFFVRCNPI